MTMIIGSLRALGDYEQPLRDCIEVLHRVQSKTALLDVYYDGKQPLKDLGISIPPDLRGMELALEWPARAVQGLARKHSYEGFSRAGRQDPYDVDEALHANDFEQVLAQGINSAYKHAVSFLTTTVGDTEAGEPPAVVTAHSADNVGAIWDGRTRRIASAVVIEDTDRFTKNANRLYFMHRNLWWRIELDNGEWTIIDAGESPVARPMIEPLRYDPQLSRPFGKSRISREVRYLTNAALRTMARAEISAEFFAAPQRYVLGVDSDAFGDLSAWSAVTGRMLALSETPSGELPTLGQFSQVSMSPHWEMYRQLAQNFCSATDLPQSRVGIYADNPASAEAMEAAEAHLAEDAENQWKIFRLPILRTYQNVATLAHGEQPGELHRVELNWTPARYVSPSQASNWAVQAVQADPTLQGSPIIQRRMGLTQGEMQEHQAWARRSNAPSLLSQILDEAEDEQNTGEPAAAAQTATQEDDDNAEDISS